MSFEQLMFCALDPNAFDETTIECTKMYNLRYEPPTS